LSRSGSATLETGNLIEEWLAFEKCRPAFRQTRIVLRHFNEIDRQRIQDFVSVFKFFYYIVDGTTLNSNTDVEHHSGQKKRTLRDYLIQDWTKPVHDRRTE